LSSAPSETNADEIAPPMSAKDQNVEAAEPPASASSDSIVQEEDSDEEHPKPRKIARSSYEMYPWISKELDGYYCYICLRHSRKIQSDVARVTVPVPLSASRKLYTKAEKHNKSAAHMAAVAASQIAGPSVMTKLIVASNESMLLDSKLMKLCFRAAYFMFVCRGVPHTTHWGDLLSTMAASDSSGRLAKYFASCPANAHHLSPAAVTSILEAFGEEICTRLREKLALVTE